MTLCILLQCATLFPHHHHAGESHAICYNFVHCTQSHSDFRDHEGCTHSKSCDDHSMQSHSHDSDHGSTCVASKLVVIKPQNDQKSDISQISFLILGGSIPSILPLTACGEQYTDTIILRNIEANAPCVEPIILTYTTKANSLRAPGILS